MVNPDFETSFEFPEVEDTLLSISNNGRVNRSLATQDKIGKTSFSAYLSHVIYGSYDGRPACLLAIDFSFRYPTNGSLSRFCYANIDVEFTRATDIRDPAKANPQCSLDPAVANFAPKEVLGAVQPRQDQKDFEVGIPVMFNAPFGLSAGITTRWSKSSEWITEGRSQVHGCLAQDEDHDDGANGLTWDISENPIVKDGILRSFRGVVILHTSPGEPFWMRVCVKPAVRFSIDPRRIFTKKMTQTNDDPVLLDGQTPKGLSQDSTVSNFEDDAFPWNRILLANDSFPAAREARSS